MPRAREKTMLFRFDFEKTPDLDGFGKKIEHYASAFKNLELDVFAKEYRLFCSIAYDFDNKCFMASYTIHKKQSGTYVVITPATDATLKELSIIKKIWQENPNITAQRQLYSITEYVSETLALVNIFCRIGNLIHYV